VPGIPFALGFVIFKDFIKTWDTNEARHVYAGRMCYKVPQSLQ
jgi:hypothetical protein